MGTKMNLSCVLSLIDFHLKNSISFTLPHVVPNPVKQKGVIL